MQHSAKNRTGLIVAILIILGLAAGLGLGLLLGWVVMPVRFVDTTIADLSPDCKDDYAILVASAYVLDGDLAKARSRVEKLEVPNPNQWLADLVDRAVDGGRNEADIQALVVLAQGLGVSSPRMVAYLPSPTPRPTNTPLPTATTAPSDTPTATVEVPTDTPVLPSDTPAPAPSDTPAPAPTDTETAAPAPSDTPVPAPSNTSAPPPPTNTRAPTRPANTPTPTKAPQPKWSWSVELLGPRHHVGQECHEGAQYIRVTVLGPGGNQLGGVWIHDQYTGLTQVTGHKGDDPFWGPGQAEIPCPGSGGASVCVASDQSGTCVSGYTRGMSCYYLPDLQDLYDAGYCNCCEPGASIDRCRELLPKCFSGAGHFSWQVTFQRNQ